MSPSVCIIIRSAGERTLARCEQIVKDQMGDVPIIPIQESPFSAAVKKTFEIGIAHGKKWTLALDADILLRDKAVHDLVSVAENLPENFFMIQGRVLDKLFCFARNGGPHLFRTSLLKEALPLVPLHTDSIRPEGETVKRMISRGYHRYKGTEVYGLHDFEQAYEDVFRTAFVHAVKFKPLVPYFTKEWESRKTNDEDYLVALEGLQSGLQYDFPNIPERNRINDLAEQAIQNLGIVSKPEFNYVIDPDRVMNLFSVSADGIQIENRDHNKVLRTDRAAPKKKKKKSLMRRVILYVKNLATRT